MVTVARATALWELILETQPELRRPFERIRQALGTEHESAAIRRAYEDVPCVSLSKGVFERAPDRLGAVTVRDVYWNDGDGEERVRETLRWLDATATGMPPYEDRFCVDWAVEDSPSSFLPAPRARTGLDKPIALPEVSR